LGAHGTEILKDFCAEESRAPNTKALGLDALDGKDGAVQESSQIGSELEAGLAEGCGMLPDEGRVFHGTFLVEGARRT
jgi:hypothetical protein